MRTNILARVARLRLLTAAALLGAAPAQDPGLRVSLVVPTLYRKTALADEILAKLRHYFPDRCAEPLAMNVAIDEAQSHGKTIWDHAPWSRGATLMQTIADDIWARRPDAALSKSA